jgi:thioredoxin reductase
VSDANITDITVIGGGPTGLYAAFYAGCAGSRAASWTRFRSSAGS